MMEVATKTSTAWISAVLEVMLAKFMAACSGDVLNSYVWEEEPVCSYMPINFKHAFKHSHICMMYMSTFGACLEYIPAEFHTA